MKSKKALHKTRITNFQQSVRKRKRKSNRRSVQMRMLRNFLTKGISAAGISHIATAKSPLFRVFWFLSTSLAITVMVLMTYRILQEYWKYPKASQTKTFSVNSLEFPAVTICSRYLLPRMNAKEANLQAMNDIYPFLKNFPSKNVPMDHKEACYEDPLCRWVQFLEKCTCDRNPCDTTLCYPEGDSDTCNCSRLLCSKEQLNKPEACRKVVQGGHEHCICRRDFVYTNYNLNDPLTPDALNESYFLNASQEIMDIIHYVRQSKTTDLRDVEHHWMPEVRVLDDFGVSYDTLFISCSFDEEPCNIKQDITTLYHANLGKCYMFNYVGEGSKSEGKPKITKHAEKRNGFQVYLHNPKQNMMPFLAMRLGVRLVIHDPYSLPYSRESGFDIRPGDMQSMPLEYAEVHRLGPPWGFCGKDGDSSTSSYLERPYNQIACERLCVNNVVFERCHCFSRRYMFGTTMPIGIRVCQPHEQTCVQKVLEDASRNKIICNCPPACSEKRYKVTPSSGKVNKEFFDFLKKAKSLKMVNGTPSVVEPDVKPHMMGVFVFYRSMTVSNISETSIYSWEFLVANIGGNMGLFLGLSLVTFVEIAEFLVDVLIKTIRLRH